ncbi:MULTISPECIES: MlaC/ttg2D family ABC transporter substrate-binding protein [unclassified Halorhodospira]|uniref:MlaC/ttg2D family ABC transporter substrate-binding protein n=1 Tax=unclassified Halorhodospira TaxID=2626748 RepID=UPI001EE8C883|nr:MULTISPECIES: ABC transporter substrate-binding protein [unclassified Halorhodospira]MCG5541092.1 ABC transporter substrate-binding protein [Halorhodospira sp. M39old]MCG5546171.1 ABC transporter substrate-binding protein [Halorhodospira sp. M38]
MDKVNRWGRSLALMLALALALALGAGQAVAKPDPRQVVEEVTDEVLRVLEEHGEEIAGDPVALYDKLAPVVEPHIDYDRIGARILGPHWRDADEQTRERFVTEFQRSLLRTYASSMEDYQGVDVRILGSRQRDGGVQVGMEVGSGDSRARILYRLEEREDAWKLVDVTAEGVSMIHNYREDFRSRLRDRDLETVIEEMAQRNREIGFE